MKNKEENSSLSKNKNNKNNSINNNNNNNDRNSINISTNSNSSGVTNSDENGSSKNRLLNDDHQRQCVVCDRDSPPTIFSCRYKVHEKNIQKLCSYFDRELDCGELCDRCYRSWYKYRKNNGEPMLNNTYKRGGKHKVKNTKKRKKNEDDDEEEEEEDEEVRITPSKKKLKENLIMKSGLYGDSEDKNALLDDSVYHPMIMRKRRKNKSSKSVVDDSSNEENQFKRSAHNNYDSDSEKECDIDNPTVYSKFNYPNNVSKKNKRMHVNYRYGREDFHYGPVSSEYSNDDDISNETSDTDSEKVSNDNYHLNYPYYSQMNTNQFNLVATFKDGQVELIGQYEPDFPSSMNNYSDGEETQSNTSDESNISLNDEQLCTTEKEINEKSIEERMIQESKTKSKKFSEERFTSFDSILFSIRENSNCRISKRKPIPRKSINTKQLNNNSFISNKLFFTYRNKLCHNSMQIESDTNIVNDGNVQHPTLYNTNTNHIRDSRQESSNESVKSVSNTAGKLDHKDMYRRELEQSINNSYNNNNNSNLSPHHIAYHSIHTRRVQSM